MPVNQDAPMHMEHRVRRDSPIFVPAVKPALQIRRRDYREHRRTMLVALAIGIFIAGAFVYAFVQEAGREAAARKAALQLIAP